MSDFISNKINKTFTLDADVIGLLKQKSDESNVPQSAIVNIILRKAFGIKSVEDIVLNTMVGDAHIPLYPKDMGPPITPADIASFRAKRLDGAHSTPAEVAELFPPHTQIPLETPALDMEILDALLTQDEPEIIEPKKRQPLRNLFK
jgi:hypothetical protein